MTAQPAPQPDPDDPLVESLTTIREALAPLGEAFRDMWENLKPVVAAAVRDADTVTAGQVALGAVMTKDHDQLVAVLGELDDDQLQGIETGAAMLALHIGALRPGGQPGPSTDGVTYDGVTYDGVTYDGVTYCERHEVYHVVPPGEAGCRAYDAAITAPRTTGGGFIIPVPVAHDAPLHVVRGDCRVRPGDRLYGRSCPVCGDPFTAGQPLSLVYVGAEPQMRKASGFMTAAAVAVHSCCTGPGPAARPPSAVEAGS